MIKNTAIPDIWNAGLYSRLSKEDRRRDGRAKDESNSIKNQKDLLLDFVSRNPDIRAAHVLADDGATGADFDRDDFRTMIAHIESGEINCVVVKDLSRIGRNMLDTDDLLMNYLVSKHVRFIAINDNYDSFLHPLSNLELAFINLINQQYNRDLALKSISAKLVKMKRGEWLSMYPFGYVVSDAAKNKLVIDPEAAGYVRLAFSLACEGKRAVEIARIFNAQGIPSPSVYKKRAGYKKVWTNAIDPDYCFWTSCTVLRLLRNEIYLGKTVLNRFRVTEHGTGKCELRPKDDWIICPDAHEAIISETEFRKAQEVLARHKYSDKPEHIFGNKVKCPSCGHAMKRSSKYNPRFKCDTVRLTDHYGCCEYSILQRELEKAVLASVKACAAAVLDREQMRLALIAREKATAGELEMSIRTEQKAAAALEMSLSKLFTSFVEEKISKDVFLSKKSAVNDMIGRKRSDIETMTERLKTLTDGRAAAEVSIAELTPLLTIDKLDRELVDLLIDKIIVHGDNDIEIVWRSRLETETSALSLPRNL
jgi:DNA invertase Pin-like site-specific DNA recombinase